MMIEFPTVHRAILDTLGSRPTAASRKALAAWLRAEADRQERIARAEERERRKPPERRMHKAGTPRGRQPARFVRIERDGDRLRIYIGRALYYELQSPARLDVQRSSGHIWLIAAQGDNGYSVIVPTAGMPRIQCDGARDIVDLEDGRYSTTVKGSALQIGPAL